MRSPISKIVKLIVLSLILNAGFSTQAFAAKATEGIQYKTVKIDELNIPSHYHLNKYE